MLPIIPELFCIKVLGIIFQQLLLSSAEKLFPFIVNKWKQICLKKKPHQSVQSLTAYTNTTMGRAEHSVVTSHLYNLEYFILILFQAEKHSGSTNLRLAARFPIFDTTDTRSVEYTLYTQYIYGTQWHNIIGCFIVTAPWLWFLQGQSPSATLPTFH